MATTPRKTKPTAADVPKIARRPIQAPSVTTVDTDPAAVVENSATPRIFLEREHQDRGGVPTDGSEDQTTVIVPKAYSLAIAAGQTVSYEAGTQEMPLSHAEHWWSRANGVTIYRKQ